MTALSGEDRARFWARVNKHGPVPTHRPELGPCWVWLSTRHSFGYGFFHHRRRMLYAHRLSWLFAKGQIAPGLCVLHHCDNPSCVNPAHLFLGSKGDNARDREQKKRRRTPPKLKPCEVLLIRHLVAVKAATRAGLAGRLGVNWSTIDSVVARKTWKHI